MKKNQLKILLADDDSMITLSIKELLTKLGHRVIAIAKNGLEAIEMTKKFEPDLIIMDIKMPELDGIEATRIIRKERPTPVIILTAYSDESLIERASEAGVLTYLVKPVSEADMKPALKLAIDRFHERRILATEVSRTKEVLESRIIIDRAKRILIKKLGCSEERAHRIIQQISRDRNTKLVETARNIISNKGVMPLQVDEDTLSTIRDQLAVILSEKIEKVARRHGSFHSKQNKSQREEALVSAILGKEIALTFQGHCESIAGIRRRMKMN